MEQKQIFRLILLLFSFATIVFVPYWLGVSNFVVDRLSHERDRSIIECWYDGFWYILLSALIVLVVSAITYHSVMFIVGKKDTEETDIQNKDL